MSLSSRDNFAILIILIYIFQQSVEYYLLFSKTVYVSIRVASPQNVHYVCKFLNIKSVVSRTVLAYIYIYIFSGKEKRIVLL